MVRCILKDKNIPKKFWKEAVTCAVYLLNKFSLKKLYNMTSEQVWSLYKSKVGHLRILGSVAHVKVHEKKRTKLDDKGEKCILLGYAENSSSYKLYNPITKKVIFSRDVDFDKK